MANSCAACGGVFASPAELLELSRKSRKESAATDVPTADDLQPEPGHQLGCAACGERFPSRETLARHNLRPHRIPGLAAPA